MKNIKFLLVSIYYFLVHSITVLAQDSLQNVQLITEQNIYPVLRQAVYLFEDSTNLLSLEEVQKMPLQQVGADSTKRVILDSKNATWLHTKIYSQLPYDKEYFLTTPYADSVEIYSIYPNGKVIQSITGTQIATKYRAIAYLPNRVHFFLPKEQIVQVWIKCIKKQSSAFLTIKLSNPYINVNFIIKNYFTIALFLGAYLLMFLYNLLLAGIFRDKAYLYYSLYILFSALFIGFVTFPENMLVLGDFLGEKWAIHILLIGFVPIFYLLFIKHFVSLKQISIPLYQFFKVYITIRIVIVIILFISNLNRMTTDLYNIIGNSVLIIDIIIGVVASVILLRSKINKTLNLFVAVGSAALLVGGLIDTVNAFNIEWLRLIISQNISYFSVGVLVEIIIFSFGLGYRSNLIEKEKQKAQEELIAQLKANEELQQNINRDLERKVAERTAEIANKNEELEAQSNLLQEQKDHLQHAYTHITDSVRYAKRIQTALLPPKEKLKDIFPHSFIFYQPKDIVSGDFYFFAPSPHHPQEFFFAVADCTGHGVPGAFMTVIGNTLLGKIINEQELSSPANILKELDHSLLKTLQQQGVVTSKDKVNDGMDIALMKINTAEQVITLASAKRVVYQFRNGALLEYSPSKYPIGGSHLHDKHFEEQRISYLSKDVFYLFTDGYADQFGGNDNRKFMIKNFRDLLTTLHHETFDKQESILLEKITAWKGNYSQTDDMLVVGFQC